MFGRECFGPNFVGLRCVQSTIEASLLPSPWLANEEAEAEKGVLGYRNFWWRARTCWAESETLPISKAVLESHLAKSHFFLPRHPTLPVTVLPTNSSFGLERLLAVAQHDVVGAPLILWWLL